MSEEEIARFDEESPSAAATFADARAEAGLSDISQDDLVQFGELIAGGTSVFKLEESDDPFDLVNAPGQQLVVLMRLYDVLMGLYMEANEEKATALMEIHDQGRLLLDYPKLVFGE